MFLYVFFLMQHMWKDIINLLGSWKEKHAPEKNPTFFWIIENVLTDCQCSSNLKCCWLNWLLVIYCLRMSEIHWHLLDSFTFHSGQFKMFLLLHFEIYSGKVKHMTHRAVLGYFGFCLFVCFNTTWGVSWITPISSGRKKVTNFQEVWDDSKTLETRTYLYKSILKYRIALFYFSIRKLAACKQKAQVKQRFLQIKITSKYCTAQQAK